MKTSILILLISQLFAFSILFAQDNPANAKFYVNSGNTEVKELTCYDFDNLMVKFDNLSQLGKYDRLVFVIQIVNPATAGKGFRAYNESRLITAKYEGKPTIESYIFSKPGQNEGFYESADVQYEYIQRSDLQLTSQDGNIEGAYIEFRLNGGVITSYTETFDAGCNCYKQKPVYDYVNISTSDKLPLKNRVKISKAKMLANSASGRTDYVKDPNCYIYSGTPTESANQTVTTTQSNTNQGGQSAQSEIKRETAPAEKKVNAAETVNVAGYQKSVEDGIVDGPFTDRKPDGRKELEGNYTNKKKNGVFKYYNNDGTAVIKEETYVKGVINGTVTEYHKNGQVKSVMTVVNDVADGPTSTSDDKGQLVSNGNMKANQPEGTWKFFKNGVLDTEINFTNGKYNGLYTIYYPNGKVSETKTYQNGAQTGVYKSYSDAGKLKTEGNYTKGIKDGVWKTYDSTGKLTKEEVYAAGVKTN